MHTYLEIIETLSGDDITNKRAMEVVVEVKDKAEALTKLPLYEPLFVGKQYIKQVHYHLHEEKQLCTVEKL